MKMTDLLRYEMPAEIIALWQKLESPALLPLQERAVKEHGLFAGGNLLVQAPTSSGKTFIGEMAALQMALRRKKVVYLVPLKALAEEKYLDFKEKYAGYGVKVIVSSRDRREFDRDLEHGNFSIAFAVYEKLAQLLVRRPERIADIDLVIADELEILSDPERGAMAELLLTRVLRGGRRLIGLSAVIGGAEQLAKWMNASLLCSDQRPVELRYGVLHEGVFHYRTYNTPGQDKEPFIETCTESPGEIMAENVRALAEKDESCLIFVKSKHEARKTARALAEKVDVGAAAEACAALRGREATRARDCLLETLAHGVGFHNADLGPEERRIVETAFRAGEVKVLVSTGTLAAGMNLPARNVFLTAEKWHYDRDMSVPWKAPLSRNEYENMSGRAGRYGAGYDFGRAVLIGVTPFDFETLWRRYIEGAREPVEPRLAKEPLENHVLRLIASRCCRTAAEVHVFLEETLTGKWIWAERYTSEEIAFRVGAAINRCMDAGMIAQDFEGRFEATPLGLATSSKGITIATAREFEHWIRESETREFSPLDVILAAASAPDGRMTQVMLTAREYEQGGYPERLKEAARGESYHADTPLNRLRHCLLQPFFEEVRAIKIALFLDAWIEHAALRAVEEEYDTMSGQVLAAAEQASWLVDAASAIAVALGCAPGFVERIETLAARLQYGVRAEMLPFARLGVKGLERKHLLALADADLDCPETLARAGVSALRAFVPTAAARELHAWAEAQLEAETTRTAAVDIAPKTPVPVLVVDDAAPCEIRLDGARIALQDKQYRLIRALAGQPGVCIPYDALIAAVWGETVVDDNQMSFQKNKLLTAIRKACPDRAKLVTTVPKRGYTLQLTPEEVVLTVGPMVAAA